MTEDQEAEVQILALNIEAVFTAEQISALCARLLEIERSVLRAWLSRRLPEKERGG